MARRHFTLLYVNNTGQVICDGLFVGLKPRQAAGKAFSHLMKIIGECIESVPFALIETTRGSKRRKYYYRGSREKLEEPIEIPIKDPEGNETVIRYAHTSKIFKIDSNECPELERYGNISTESTGSTEIVQTEH